MRRVQLASLNLEDGVSWGQRGKGEINFNAITVLAIICLFIYSSLFTVQSPYAKLCRHTEGP